MAHPTPRTAAEAALLDAAERLLVDAGHAAVTTRRLAEQAGVNHGLVHYDFGSIENELAQTFNQGMMLERLVGIDEGHAELLAWAEEVVRDDG